MGAVEVFSGVDDAGKEMKRLSALPLKVELVY
jgi:hypothetical protein